MRWGNGGVRPRGGGSRVQCSACSNARCAKSNENDIEDPVARRLEPHVIDLVSPVRIVQYQPSLPPFIPASSGCCFNLPSLVLRQYHIDAHSGFGCSGLELIDRILESRCRIPIQVWNEQDISILVSKPEQSQSSCYRS